MISGKRLPRLIVRLVCFASASAVLWPVLPWKSSPRIIVPLSPFTAICSSLALRSIGFIAGIGLIFAAVALIKRRWFCFCPPVRAAAHNARSMVGTTVVKVAWCAMIAE